MQVLLEERLLALEAIRGAARILYGHLRESRLAIARLLCFLLQRPLGVFSLMLPPLETRLLSLTKKATKLARVDPAVAIEVDGVPHRHNLLITNLRGRHLDIHADHFHELKDGQSTEARREVRGSRIASMEAPARQDSVSVRLKSAGGTCVLYLSERNVPVAIQIEIFEQFEPATLGGLWFHLDEVLHQRRRNFAHLLDGSWWDVLHAATEMGTLQHPRLLAHMLRSTLLACEYVHDCCGAA